MFFFIFPAEGRLSECSTRWDFPHVTNWLTPASQHAKRKSGRSGGSGLFPAIKTALVDVCHRKKVWHVTILKSYGELGLGRSAQGPTRTKMLSQNSNSTEFSIPFTEPHNLRPAGAPRVNLVRKRIFIRNHFFRSNAILWNRAKVINFIRMSWLRQVP